MYLFDPVTGQRRRALIRDKTLSSWRETEQMLTNTSREVQGSLHGLRDEASVLFKEGKLPPRTRDALLTLQVKAAVALAASQPQALEIHMEQGRVVLGGSVLRQDLDEVMSAASAVRGVEGVDNRLAVVERPEELPAGSPDQQLFSPSSQEGKLVLGTTGGVLLLYAAIHRGLLGTAAGVLGSGLLVRSFGSEKMQRMLGMLENDEQEEQPQGQQPGQGDGGAARGGKRTTGAQNTKAGGQESTPPRNAGAQDTKRTPPGESTSPPPGMRAEPPRGEPMMMQPPTSAPRGEPAGGAAPHREGGGQPPRAEATSGAPSHREGGGQPPRVEGPGRTQR